ncbi:LacI family gluconate utilization system Gnt-I transcriptional repressor [Neorhizobium galegae]|uniref:LacI family DNA-binding transcriptional regulator n=1 Tax=Neorhizobium galegae TaxID=399 RepID=UPI00278085DE|nr:LacI family DNA-binding transcriptional regulator [Neorhizobium galegae]MDQ0137694.1 LacI family gluconate utilization system Gnt-I transcriptional repressor [Neorhizobium galegae]
MKRKTPTMVDVARLAGVTSMTVSRALREDTRVSEETRKRISEAAEMIGYVLDGSAAGLKARKTGFVAVVIPTVNNSNFAETVQGIDDRLAGSRLQVLLGYTNYSVEREERAIESLLVRRPEAIIVTGTVHTRRTQRLLENAGIPVVEMWEAPKNPIQHAVGFSNFDAGNLVAKHLIAKGYKALGFIGGADNADARGAERLEGYTAAVQQAGYEPVRVTNYGRPPITMLQGGDAMRAMLQTWPDTDAVMCVSDLLAFGALSECQRQGIAVPDGIAIAGFGNYDVGQVCFPSLTTIDVDARGIGTAAADVVLASLSSSANVDAGIHKLTPVTLMARQST